MFRGSLFKVSLSSLNEVFLAAGHIMFRQATKDTTVQLPRPTGQEGFEALPLPKGTLFCIDMVGLRAFYSRPSPLQTP